MNQLSAIQYLIDRTNLGGGKGRIKDAVYYSIAKAYQDIIDGHYDMAIQRLRNSADTIEYIEDKQKNWETLRTDFK
jgi:demethoxyubiquinone hydroxylase (CLK1/Coq7/Cat5 family)